MGFRFRRSFKIAPGLRLNVSKSGVSASVGRRGASVTVGPRGTSATVGIPGTGLSYTGTASTTRNSGSVPVAPPGPRLTDAELAEAHRIGASGSKTPWTDLLKSKMAAMEAERDATPVLAPPPPTPEPADQAPHNSTAVIIGMVALLATLAVIAIAVFR